MDSTQSKCFTSRYWNKILYLDKGLSMRTPLFHSLVLAATITLAASPTTAQDTASGHTISVNGIEMYYETMGAGEPLLLVHGWSGNAQYFNPILGKLASHYSLIIPELRGHGRSTNPTGMFTIEHTASDVLALLEQLGLSHVRALGASAGGLTLLSMAIQDTAAIEMMIVVGVGTHFPEACRASMAATDTDNYSSEWWEVMRERHPNGDAQIEEIARYLRELSVPGVGVGFAREELSSITARTLIVQGDNDWCFPPPLVAEMHRTISDADLWVIPNGEHVPILGPRAAIFLETALKFYKGEPLE
jgi:pimeloyl-ACP methyl ester carboxylesterase